MDKKKKIITIIGAILFITAFSVFIKFMLFPQLPTVEENDNFNIATPSVDEKKIPHDSKLKRYQQEEFETYNKDTLDSEASTLLESNLDKIIKRQSAYEHGVTSKNDDDYYDEDEVTNAQLKKIMELQSQALNPTLHSFDNNDDNALLLNEMYSQYGLNQEDINQFESLQKTIQTQLQAKTENTPEEIKIPIIEKFTSNPKNYFQGAGSSNDNKKNLDLIPAETVDQAIIKSGSIIAIRIQRDISVKDPRVFIPKGSIVYGKVTISNRLMISIESYKSKDKLYLLDFKTYDFDGREGLNLDNRTWSKIPSKVAKDVYEYAYQRGTQASAFGGDNTISLDQAKDIAILSSAKHIGEEVFEKRKVFMPKKYHLWFNVNNL